MTETDRHYSGSASRKFWQRVKAVRAHSDYGLIYTQGTQLQTLEIQTLARLESAERAMKKGKKAR